ncbi:MAG: type effector protein [Rhodospirillales bacterium]|nr:type effector protein [Rhodospirillales bacterium]
MSTRSLIPFLGTRTASLSRSPSDPLQAFRSEMDRLFDDFFTGSGASGIALMRSGGMPAAVVPPQIDVSETDHDIQIKADLPGLDENDIDIFVVDDVLTLRGEKKAEREEEQRGWRLVERSSGAFSRVLRLPFAVDPAQVDAAFKNGVLTITIPKPTETQDQVHKITVKKTDTETPAETAEAKPAESAPGETKPAEAA